MSSTHLDEQGVIFHFDNTNKVSAFEFKSKHHLMKKVGEVQYWAQKKIITGAWQGFCRKNVYDNLGWESLNNHRIM